MAGIIARAYANCIKRGIRKIDDVRPDRLKNEVIELLVGEGRYDLAEVEEPIVDKEDTIEEKPAEETEPESKKEAENKEVINQEKDEPKSVENKEV